MKKISRQSIEYAIEHEQFLIQYQPKMARLTGRSDWVTTEAEALIRWRHPEHGRLSPMEFLPAAEHFGLIEPVSEFVLSKTLNQLNRWRENGLHLNGCVNLSTALLSDKELPRKYEKLARDHGLPCDAITFELPQADIAGEESAYSDVASALRRKGFRLSLDDFGAAAASLSSFGQLAFDEIKIHASLLAQARTNPVTRQALAAVTGMAHALNISVCAEGVEDEVTFEFLKEIKCDKMQGYFISEAVMPDIIQSCYPTVDAATARAALAAG